MSRKRPRLRDLHFDDAYVARLAADVAAAYPPADAAALRAAIATPAFAAMPLLEEMHHVTTCLHEVLPADFPRALAILRELAPAYDGFEGMVFADYVARYGGDHWDLSMAALRDFTRYAGAELALRPFLRHDQPRTLITLRAWAADPDPAVRRLACEAARPHLPWAISLPALQQDPRPLLPILERLKEDPDPAVRRSVANCLNDIARDHPQMVTGLAQAWHGRSPACDRMLRHACRPLLKGGVVPILRLFGYAEPTAVQVRYLGVRPADPAIGDDVTLHADVVVGGAEPLPLRVEYAITFVRARGPGMRKVFQMHDRPFAPGRHTVRARHSLRDLATRRHYPGQHLVEIMVNGVVKATTAMHLRAATAESVTAGRTEDGS